LKEGSLPDSDAIVFLPRVEVVCPRIVFKEVLSCALYTPIGDFDVLVDLNLCDRALVFNFTFFKFFALVAHLPLGLVPLQLEALLDHIFLISDTARQEHRPCHEVATELAEQVYWDRSLFHGNLGISLRILF